MSTFLSKADYFLCQGEAWQHFALNDLGLQPDRVKIIPNWTATKDVIDIGTKKILFSNVKGKHFVCWMAGDYKGILN